MGKARFGTAIGGIGATIGAIGAIGAFQIVHEHGAAAFHYRSYRRGHYRTIGEGTIGLSELSDYYRTTIGVLSESTIGTIGPRLYFNAADDAARSMPSLMPPTNRVGAAETDR